MDLGRDVAVKQSAVSEMNLLGRLNGSIIPVFINVMTASGAATLTGIVDGYSVGFSTPTRSYLFPEGFFLNFPPKSRGIFSNSSVVGMLRVDFYFLD